MGFDEYWYPKSTVSSQLFRAIMLRNVYITKHSVNIIEKKYEINFLSILSPFLASFLLYILFSVQAS